MSNDQTCGPVYPDCIVELIGEDGNAFSIIGRVSAAIKTHLREEGVDASKRTAIAKEFTKEATSGDYDHLLQTCMNWVNVQ